MIVTCGYEEQQLEMGIEKRQTCAHVLDGWLD